MQKDQTLARTLGIPEVVLLGVGALLGGGIFTLLGHAAGLAGGGLVFSMIIGAAISFINLNSYVALATTFPAAGGGYHWIRDGLGSLNGFMSGWFSWMASAVACALYAVSFGFFAQELFFNYLGLPHEMFSDPAWETILTIGVIFLFGFVNYRGVRLSGKIGGVIAILVLSILAIFIVFGAKHMLLNSGTFVFNFSPIMPFGIAGVLQAAALFYIAFEGSEIQAQAGEEVENPARVLKVGLFSSWAIVSIVYVLIAIVIIGATNGAGGAQSFDLLGRVSERAIIESAKQVMPFGYLIMLIAGLLANLAALNATIYSSSRVLFSMGRDKLVFKWLGVMHPIRYIPARALILSLIVVIIIATIFPLTDIASAADILFIALFMQLNLAYVELRRQKPEVKWRYVVPFGALLPLSAVALYFILGISLFHVSPLAIYFLCVWALLGLVNYLGYAKGVEREQNARDIVYEHSIRFHPKSEYRVILPLGPRGERERFAQIAGAMTHEKNGDLIALRIHEVDDTNAQSVFHADQDKNILEKIEASMAKKKVNINMRIISANSIAEAILETIISEKANLVLMNWDGDVNTKGFIFGRKVDVVLHRAKCDLLTVKLGSEERMQSIFIPVAIDANPNLRFTGKVATALHKEFGSTITVAMIVPEDIRGLEDAFYQKILEEHVRDLKIGIAEGIETKIIYSDYLASGIIKASSGYDVVLLPAARSRISKAIGVGSIPEQVGKYYRRKTVLIAKGYRGIAKPFWDYLAERF